MEELTPEILNRLTNDDINRIAKSAWERQYAALEADLKRYDPLEWALMVGGRIHFCRGNMNALRMTPPHWLLHSLEACMGYCRKFNRHCRVDLDAVASVMKLYSDFADPMQLALAGRDFFNWVVIVDREQFQLQVRHSERDIARWWLLFADGDPVPELSAAFQRKYDITILQWLQLCYATFATAFQDGHGRVTLDCIENYSKGQLHADQIEWFVRKSSRTPEELGKKYREDRARTAPHFHCCIPSPFLETPLINFGAGRLLAPEPLLIFAHAANGLHRLLKSLPGAHDEFGEEFGGTVEAHVARVLRCYKGHLRMLEAQHLKPLTEGRSCDFLLDAPDCILLVESKAAIFERYILMPAIMQGDNSTAKIVGAFGQLRETCEALRSGTFDHFGIDRNKPVLAIVATYGHLPLPNTDWYFENVFEPFASRGGNTFLPDFGLPRRPAVMSLDTLEMFVTALNFFSETPLQSFEERGKHPFLSAGDWNNHLRTRLSNAGTIESLPFVRQKADEFFVTLGCPKTTP